MELCLELRPADFGTSNHGACPRCGWPWLERPGFSGVRGQLGRLLKDRKPSSEWAGVAMCFRSCGQKSGHFRCWKLGCRAYFLEVRAQRIHSGTTSCVVKELEIGMGGLQGMLCNFHKLKGPHKVVDDGYYQDSMNSVLQTSLSAVKMCTTCRHGHYLCREEVKKGFYAVRCMVQSLAIRGFRRLAVRRQPAVLADCKVVGMRMSTLADLHVGETHVRVSVMMLPVLRGSDGKSHVSCHMHESVCCSRFRFRPSDAADAQNQDGIPHMSG